MALKDFREVGRENTKKASDIARSLALAGIGIIWVIISGRDDVGIDDPRVITPLIFVTVTLLVDLFQYFVAGLIWLRFYRLKEAQGIKDTDDIKSKKWRSNVIYLFFYVKFLLVVISYILIVNTLFTFY